jgi:hypothetical protein
MPDKTITPMIAEDLLSEQATANSTQSSDPQTIRSKRYGKSYPRYKRSLIIIILIFTFLCSLGMLPLYGQLEISATLQTAYTDNAFQLSSYDMQRFNQSVPALDYVNTTDDAIISARFDVAYPIKYQWWKFTPTVTGSFSQNLSNTDKQRRDALLRLRVDRYYWNATLLYGYYPNVHVRSYVDTDGTGTLEDYSYASNLYRGDVNIKPLKNTTLHLSALWQQYFYNQYWTEYDGNATQLGIQARYSFPVFSLGGSYSYRVFDNYRHHTRDASYESNIYSGDIQLKSMPLSDSKPDGVTWYPALALSYEQRYYQGNDDWYGGRADLIYHTDASLNFDIDAHWNIKLDYSHAFRNVDSPVAEVLLLKEFSENELSAAVKYSF